MFRFLAAATAGLAVFSLGASGVFAEGLGSSIAPAPVSPASSPILFLDANLPARTTSINDWSQTAGMSPSKSGASTFATPAVLFVDSAQSPTFGTAWSPLNFVTNAKPVRMSPLSESQNSVDSYFGMFESLSRHGAATAPAATGSATARMSR